VSAQGISRKAALFVVHEVSSLVCDRFYGVSGGSVQLTEEFLRSLPALPVPWYDFCMSKGISFASFASFDAVTLTAAADGDVHDLEGVAAFHGGQFVLTDFFGWRLRDGPAEDVVGRRVMVRRGVRCHSTGSMVHRSDDGVSCAICTGRGDRVACGLDGCDDGVGRQRLIAHAGRRPGSVQPADQ